MPELPEVHTIASQLQAVLPGKVIESVQVLREKSFKGEVNQLIGKSVNRVGRKAKMIVVELNNTIPDHAAGATQIRDRKANSATSEESLTMLIHLKMTGQLIWVEGKKRVVGGHPTADWINALPSKHTRVIIHFEDGSTLFFNDMRVFGWVKIATSDEWLAIRDRLPPDVVDKEFTVEYLARSLKQSTRSVKLVLLDQAKIGGMGNIYTNDALYLAHTKPTRKANTLKIAEINRLHKACIQVIKRGIATGGASENTYKHIDGLGGDYQKEFLIYKREGDKCGLGGRKGIIKKIKLGGRGTYFCPVCQK